MKRYSKKILLKKAQSVLEQEGNAVLQLSRQVSEVVMEIAEFMLNCKGHILVTGAGTSRAVSQRFAHLLACCGTPALFINAADALHGGAGAITSNDIVYVISKGGKSREINTFVEIVKSRGAKIVAHTENPNSPLAQLSDLVYHIVAPPKVDPYGMIATGSSLVNSAACDVLCVLLLTLRDYSKKAFGETHPEGAVGVKLAQEKK